MKRLADLGLILTSPSGVAHDVVEDPHWVIPLIVVLAASFITAAFTAEYTLEAVGSAMEQAASESGTGPDIDSVLKATPLKRALIGGAALLWSGVMVLVIAAALKGAASVAGGGIAFRRMFSFAAYSGVITALGGLIKTPLVLAKGSLDVRTSLLIAAPSVEINSPLAVLLGAFDVFVIWQIVALCFGFSVLSGFSIRKSTGIVVGLWAALVLIRIGLAMIPRLTGVG